MATMTDYNIIKELVDNDGVFPGDPQLLAIYEYKNAGKTVWCAIIVPEDEMAMFDSPYVKEPTLLWSMEKGKIKDPTPGGD
jgi:hypothetical protein